MQARRSISVHQSLHRHSRILGAERELVMLSALAALLVGLGGLTLLSGFVAFVFWVLALMALRRMAKVDPMMSKVWMRHIKQQEYYSAKSSRWRTLEGYKVQK